MNKKSIAIDLIIPKETVVFFGPSTIKEPKRETLRGKLRVVTTQPISLSQIEICYQVQARLNWRDPTQHNIIFTKRMTAIKTLRKSKRTLVQNVVLSTGLTEIDFEVIIPSQVCASFKSAFCQVDHKLKAKLYQSSKLASLLKRPMTRTEKTIQIKRVFTPKDVLLGWTEIPRSMLIGQSNLIQWSFKVPTSVSLQDTVEFEGQFLCSSNNVTLNKVLVDVVQEEIYMYDIASTDYQKRLVQSANTPSTYVEPPLNTDICFSFPLINDCAGTKRVEQPQQADKLFDCALDSPFLKIRHYIRVVLHINEGASICIELPIHISPHIELLDDDDDDLPTYQTVLKDNRLPKYRR